jgi:hypothetical protein
MTREEFIYHALSNLELAKINLKDASVGHPGAVPAITTAMLHDALLHARRAVSALERITT